jgi:hypothetical protein
LGVNGYPEQPASQRRLPPLVLALVFVVSLFSSYVAISPINHLDWATTAQFLRYMVHLHNPYDTTLTMDADLSVYHDQYEYLPYSPWIVFYFGIFAFSTTRLIVALSIAAWIVIILDSGKPIALILCLHPTFLMLWASGNIDFLVSGVGLWLMLRQDRGWRMGVAFMLAAIKPQVLPFLLALEGLRLLWRRDWPALTTILGIALVSIALYPHWLEWPVSLVRDYVDVVQGRKTAYDIAIGGKYPFSVFGAWGILAALGVSALIILIMRRRLTEWRFMAVLLGFVWTPYVNPYSYAILLLLMRKAPAWRVLLYLGMGLAALPVFFAEWHHYERYGLLLFLLLVAVLSKTEFEHTEEGIAQRHREPIFPPAQPFLRRNGKRVLMQDSTP